MHKVALYNLYLIDGPNSTQSKLFSLFPVMCSQIGAKIIRTRDGLGLFWNALYTSLSRTGQVTKPSY